MALPTTKLADLLRMGSAWQSLARVAPEEIDSALSYVEFLEDCGGMSRREAAGWRWKILACWAELQRRSRAADVALGEPRGA
jgi:hypothetical protein